MTSAKAEPVEQAPELSVVRSEPPAPDEAAAARKRELKQLLSGKRYEEALELLLHARAETPDDPAISRGIRLLKDRLLLGYLRRLGDLERVPMRQGEPEPLADVEALVFALVDGIASVEDIVHTSTVGRFETCRCLTKLLLRGAISLAEPAPWSLPVPDPRAQPEGASISNIPEALRQLDDLDGLLGASLVDADARNVLAVVGGATIDLELASLSSVELLSAHRKSIHRVGLVEQIEDIVVTLQAQYHVMRPLKRHPQVFIYAVADRSRSNLALVRMQLADVEAALKV
ncbi:MAG: hypothetical protein H6718_19890 [Polyangiaceae bacterium]|nr:hypothetical protein [Polyangiaceae bacterium]MCB9605527.1 hypothetical protein [Polyangiaceae bacterium]